MTTKETEQKAQFIYNKLLNQQPKALDLVLLSLSQDYSDDPVMLLDDWTKDFDTADLFDLIRNVKDYDGLNLDDTYVRAGEYYYSAKSSDRAADLVDEEEAIDWITSSLEEDYAHIAKLVASCKD